MKTVKVPGKHKEHKVLVYVLSTCAWCRKVKEFLKECDVEHEYVEVDLADNETREKIKNELEGKGAPIAFPTTLIDNEILITGHQEAKLKEVLGIGDS